MYHRLPNSKFTIENKDEQKFLLDFINDKILKKRQLVGLGIVIENETAIGVVAHPEGVNQPRSYKLEGEFPLIKVLDQNSKIIGEAVLEGGQFKKNKKEKPKEVKPEKVVASQPKTIQSEIKPVKTNKVRTSRVNTPKTPVENVVESITDKASETLNISE